MPFAVFRNPVRSVPALILSALILPALILPDTAGADTKAVYESSNGQGNLTVSVKGPMARLDGAALAAERKHVLYDSARGVIIVVDDERKELMEIRPEQIRQTREQMQNQLAPMMKQMQEQLKNMPPEQRRKIEKQMSSMMPTPGGAPRTTYTTKKIGSGRVMGIPCLRHSVLMDGKPMHEVCLATPAAAKVPAGDYRTIRKMFESMREMASAAASVSMPVGGAIDGIPLEMKNNADGSVQVVKSISTATLPASDFALPPYETVTFGAIPGMK